LHLIASDCRYDADAVYINIPESSVRFSKRAAPSSDGAVPGAGKGMPSAAGEGASSDEGDEEDEEEEGEGAGEEAAEDEGVQMVRRLHKLGNASALDSQLKVR
jgi:hypothetical protein